MDGSNLPIPGSMGGVEYTRGGSYLSALGNLVGSHIPDRAVHGISVTRYLGGLGAYTKQGKAHQYCQYYTDWYFSAFCGTMHKVHLTF